ncbi:MAG: hypothetical protein Q7S57_00695 [bacterium]|nr:hypothetical protein [bacterium]
MEYAFFLGSNPGLSAVEVHDYFKRIKIVADFDLTRLPKYLIVKTDETLKCQAIIDGLGGTPMIAQIIGELPDLSAETIIEKTGLESRFSEGQKPIFSISFETLGTSLPASKSPREIRTLGIEIKKLLNKKGCRVVVPQIGTSLSTAQLFNSGVPFKAVGIHIIELESGRYVAMIVTAVQDIDFYTRRDRERPEADPGKGMLPVKLAQIFINFTQAEIGSKIYDPFCGAGTIVAEAMLQGFNVIATDISLRQVERTKINTDWLKNTFPNLVDPRKNIVVMAQDIEKPLREIENNSIDAIASEGWLGPATNHELSAFEIENVFVRTQQLLYALLANVSSALKSGATVVVALPAFRVDKRIVRAPFMQEELRKFLPKGYKVESLVPEGWTNPAFRDAGQGMMLYGRPDAVILRDIVRIRKTN